ncbi:MAG: class I tRNA ligase family protein, partial [Deltaproteobacteria bacterium]|nr:class I tRNA ligase family protein [Deltaproteobacteria bacterium]
HNFCVIDLSSFYLDIIKDRLYTSPPESMLRRSAQTAMHEILEVVVRLMAPVMSFTADEIWQYMKGNDRQPSVHADLFIPVKEEYRDAELAARWEEIIRVRRDVTKALEMARKDKRIGHSLDAAITLSVPEPLYETLTPYQDQLRSIFIVSSVRLICDEDLDGAYNSEEIDGLKVSVMPSEDRKCERCWVHDSTVGTYDEHPSICRRCLDAVRESGYHSP